MAGLKPRRRRTVEKDIDTHDTNVALVSVPSIERDDVTGLFFLLDEDGARVRPVCASAKANSVIGDVCTRNAGEGTNHPGEGRCVAHGGAGEVKGNHYLELIDLNGNSDFNKLQKDVERVGDSIYKHDSEIQLLTIIISMMVKEELENTNVVITSNGAPPPARFGKSFVDKLSRLTSNVTIAKRERAKEESKLTIDFKQLQQFVDRIFQIVEDTVSASQAQKINRRIMTEVIGAVDATTN